jgi:hypothetical protein
VLNYAAQLRSGDDEQDRDPGGPAAAGATAHRGDGAHPGDPGDAIRNLAREQGREAAAAAPIETVVALSQRFQGGGPLAEGSLTIEVVEDDAERFGFDVTHCQFVDMYASLEAGDLGFLLSCNRDFASFEGMAPALAFDRTQTRMQGASHCDFRYHQPG